jgi:hypothetical protein
VIPSAYLRVFRPLEAFPERERARWERYIMEGGRPSVARPIYRDEPTAGEGRVGLLSQVDADHAEIRLVDGTQYVCPWRTRLRNLTGILSLKDTAPAEMVEVFLPETETRRAARELARIRRRDPHAASTILQSAWHVPVRWFVLVDEPERRLIEVGSGQYRLYYWTALSLARKRAEAAILTLGRTELSPLAPLVREMLEWLAAFPSECRLELDYGEVSSLFSWDELDDDHSGGDIQAAIQSLGGPGGMARAGELYQTVSGRWAEAMSRESLN